jgi:hypothetical protein
MRSRLSSRVPVVALLGALLGAPLAACGDPGGPAEERPPALEVAMVDSAPPLLVRLDAAGGAPRPALSLARVAPIPRELDVFGSGWPLGVATVRDLDFVRWSPDGRAVAAIATRTDINAAVVVLFDVATGDARPASVVGQNLGALDWSPDGTRLAYHASLPRGRSSTNGVGTTDVATGASRLLFLGDTLGWTSGQNPESVRWGAGGEVSFAVWRRDRAPEERLTSHSTLYAVDPATRRLRVVRDSVPGKVAELSRAGDFVLLLRNPTGDPAPPPFPDFRQLVRLDLATGRETVLLDRALVRAARLTHRDEYVVATVYGGLGAGIAPPHVLVHELLTPTGRRVGTVARQEAHRDASFIWGSRLLDVRVR